MVHFPSVTTLNALKPSIQLLAAAQHVEYRAAKATLSGNPTPVGSALLADHATHPEHYYILPSGNYVIIYELTKATNAIIVLDHWTYHDFAQEMGWIPGSPQ